jgi:hypothetical protein
MSKPAANAESNSSAGLRLYGGACVFLGFTVAGVLILLERGPRGAGDWRLVGLIAAGLVILGIGVTLLKRWAVALFALLSSLFGVCYLFLTLWHVPPLELMDLTIISSIGAIAVASGVLGSASVARA